MGLKKLTYKAVKDQIEKEGYKLLSKEYKNNNTKLKIRCSNGHEWSVTWNNFQQGNRCLECSGKKKLTYEYVKEQIEKEGYKLLSKEYFNAQTKLKVKCSKGHKYKVNWGHFQQGNRCPECSGKKKLTHEYVKEYIEKEGYKLLSKEYKNAFTKLKTICPNGHKYKVKWNDFQQGYRCSECSGNKKLTHEFVKEQIEKEGYKLLSKTYKNNKNKLKVKCPKDHEYEVVYDCFNHGQRCSECSGNKKLTHEFVKEQIEKDGYKLLSKEYKNSNTKLKVKCPKGHVYKVVWDSFKQGIRCPKCYDESTSSKAEIEIFEFIKNIYDDIIISNDRTQIVNPETGFNLELDIWLPELNKAIEFNGVYWHSLPKRKIRDKIKKQQCKENNINLLIIDENLWNFNKEKCLEKIKEFIL
jgi:ribosomal protein S27E